MTLDTDKACSSAFNERATILWPAAIAQFPAA